MVDIYSPDRLLRINAALNLRRHEGVRNALKWYRENPIGLQRRTHEFDRVLKNLRIRIVNGDVDVDQYQHAMKLQEVFGDNRHIPTLNEIAKISSRPQEGNLILNSVAHTFSKIDDLLSDEWSWAGNLDPQKTASGLLIEGYGLMLEDQYKLPGLRRAFVQAFEEELIFNHPRSEILKDVLPWMEEEKDSFSPAVQKKMAELSPVFN